MLKFLCKCVFYWIMSITLQNEALMTCTIRDWGLIEEHYIDLEGGVSIIYSIFRVGVF